MDTEINLNYILAHIVGINDHNKQHFTQIFNSSKILKNILLIDVDIISTKINDDDNMKNLLNKFEFYKNQSINKELNIDENKLSLNKSKEIEKKIFQYWKVKMEYYINKLSKNDNKVILIGYLSFYNNPKININLDIIPKFYVKVNYLEHAKKIIKYNIENYKDDIINSKFDLDLLDSNNLIKKRIQLQTIYNKIFYITMPLRQIINSIELFYQNIKPLTLYYASFRKYDKKIPIFNNHIIAYTDEWLALSSILYNDNNDLIKKGVSNNQQYINLTKDQFKNMSNNGYIYEINDVDNFIPYPNTSCIYKFLTVKPIKFEKNIAINNIVLQLQKLNINIKLI